jgi:hypothetical protein
MPTRARPRPADPSVVQRIFDMYIAGYGIFAIAEALTRDDTPVSRAARSLAGTFTPERITYIGRADTQDRYAVTFDRDREPKEQPLRADQIMDAAGWDQTGHV